MTEIARHAPANQTTGPVVWILMTGEMYEGGTIRRVFASKDDAKGAFVEAARGIPFDIDRAWQDDTGAVHVEGGCDWVALTPHTVTGRTQLPQSTP